jgi:hypothetical protein
MTAHPPPCTINAPLLYPPLPQQQDPPAPERQRQCAHRAGAPKAQPTPAQPLLAATRAECARGAVVCGYHECCRSIRLSAAWAHNHPNLSPADLLGPAAAPAASTAVVAAAAAGAVLLPPLLSWVGWGACTCGTTHADGQLVVSHLAIVMASYIRQSRVLTIAKSECTLSSEQMRTAETTAHWSPSHTNRSPVQDTPPSNTQTSLNS